MGRFLCWALCLGWLGLLPATAQELQFDADEYGKSNLSFPQDSEDLYETLAGMRAKFEVVGGLNENDKYRILSRPIGRLDMLMERSSDGARYVTTCTAAIVSKDSILTNYHCVPGTQSGVSVKIASLLMDHLSPEREATDRYPVETSPVEADKALDYALLRVSGNPAAKFGSVSLQFRDPVGNESLFIFHHPGGLPKRLTRFDCKAHRSALDGNAMRHRCDTLPGSSGALIFALNDERVVGLHNQGGLNTDQTSFNKGVRLAALVQKSAAIRDLEPAQAKTPPPTGDAQSGSNDIGKMLRDFFGFTDPDDTPASGDKVAVVQPSEPGNSSDSNVSQQTDDYPVGKKFRDCDVCPELIVVPAGSFFMGSPENEPKRVTSEGPQHVVTISNNLAVGVFEVTWADWEACLSSGACHEEMQQDAGGTSGWGRGNRPVINVSWRDTQAYVNWLKSVSGKPYRLLSEAEWEYAARAGTIKPFNTGDLITTSQANFDGRYPYDGTKGIFRGMTLPVGSFTANEFGLHDMHGNVWEWVEDCWNDTYGGAPSDGRAWLTGDCNKRVVRGGSWDDAAKNLRSAHRNRINQDYRLHYYGFRVSRTLAE